MRVFAFSVTFLQSSDILRYLRQFHIPCGSHVLMDDFALKKWHTYGTIIVDENSHITVAVLDE